MNKKIIFLTLVFFFYIGQSCNENSSNAKLVKEYYTNGELAREFYINNDKQKSGLYKEYYENGRIRYLYFYLDNLLSGEQREYYDNGNLKATACYKKSKPDSIVKWYYPDGVLKSESFRLEGHLFGVQKEYSPIGRLKDMYFMKNDTDQLFSFSFNEGGEIVSQPKKFIYCIYERETLTTSDTVKLIFYTIVPPKYIDVSKIIEKGKNGLYHSEVVKLDSINNNKGVLFIKKFTSPGDYEIGLILNLKNPSVKSSIEDSLYIPIKIESQQ
ncbi:MAG: hypothetical protein KBF74_12620 [Ferruginibacter sp.]|nr:hypothetical protein [Ferruginibacter sp.]